MENLFAVDSYYLTVGASVSVRWVDLASVKSITAVLSGVSCCDGWGALAMSAGGDNSSGQGVALQDASAKRAGMTVEVR